MKKLFGEYSLKDAIIMRGNINSDDRYKVYATSLQDMSDNKYIEIYDLRELNKFRGLNGMDLYYELEESFKRFINIILSIMIEDEINESDNYVKILNTSLGVCITYDINESIKSENSYMDFTYHNIKIASNITMVKESARKRFARSIKQSIKNINNRLIKSNKFSIIQISQGYDNSIDSIRCIDIRPYIPAKDGIGFEKVEKPRSLYGATICLEDNMEYIDKDKLSDIYCKYVLEVKNKSKIECYEELLSLINNNVDIDLYDPNDTYEKDDTITLFLQLLYLILQSSIKDKRDKFLISKISRILNNRIFYALDEDDAIHLEVLCKNLIMKN